MASKVFIEEMDKSFEILMDKLLLPISGFGDVKIPTVIENQTLVLVLEWNLQWCNEF